LWLAAWKDWAHVPVFLLATSFLLHALSPWLNQSATTRLPRALRIALCAFGTGALLELLQPYYGRDRSGLDLAYDGAGV
jgi:hypothetical protein